MSKVKHLLEMKPSEVRLALKKAGLGGGSILDGGPSPKTILECFTMFKNAVTARGQVAYLEMASAAFPQDLGQYKTGQGTASKLSYKLAMIGQAVAELQNPKATEANPREISATYEAVLKPIYENIHALKARRPGTELNEELAFMSGGTLKMVFGADLYNAEIKKMANEKRTQFAFTLIP